jgi:uncharacterized membrane protein
MILGYAKQLERSLASLLPYGTLLASLLMAAGVLTGLSTYGAAASLASSMTTAGVGVVILLPVCRVLLMALLCSVAGEYRFACIAAIVMAIVMVSCAIGLKLGVVAA